LTKLGKDERRRLRNKSVRTYVKTCTRRAQEAIDAGASEEAQAGVVRTISALDRAASKGVIHPNRAARSKSRLVKKLNQALGNQA